VTAIFDFERWLIENHPDVNLLPHQWEWIKAMEGGTQCMWMGIASGKTYTMKLYREYKAWTMPIRELEQMWFAQPKRHD
jgi:phosphomevalonate kinase